MKNGSAGIRTRVKGSGSLCDIQATLQTLIIEIAIAKELIGFAPIKARYLLKILFDFLFN